MQAAVRRAAERALRRGRADSVDRRRKGVCCNRSEQRMPIEPLAGRRRPRTIGRSVAADQPRQRIRREKRIGEVRSRVADTLVTIEGSRTAERHQDAYPRTLRRRLPGATGSAGRQRAYPDAHRERCHAPPDGLAATAVRRKHLRHRARRKPHVHRRYDAMTVAPFLSPATESLPGAGGPWLLMSSGRLAGEEGFEPSDGGSKVRCLTTWRLPSGTSILPGHRAGGRLPQALAAAAAPALSTATAAPCRVSQSVTTATNSAGTSSMGT